MKTIPNWQSSWNRTSRVPQTNQNYCHHICVCSDLQALVFKCIAGCHLVALGHGMLTEDWVPSCWDSESHHAGCNGGRSRCGNHIGTECWDRTPVCDLCWIYAGNSFHRFEDIMGSFYTMFQRLFHFQQSLRGSNSVFHRLCEGTLWREPIVEHSIMFCAHISITSVFFGSWCWY